MQIEILLNNQTIDLPTDSQRTYQFDSPIFKSVNALTNNRTYQFEIPLTERNRNLVAWCFQVDIVTDLPYYTLSYEERRGGVTFIKGVATIQSISSQSIYLTVVWGNTLPMLTLKDINLQEMENKAEYIQWDANSKVLPAESSEEVGFLLADYGRGLPNNVQEACRNLIPSVNLSKVLALIETHTQLKDEKGVGLKFIFPDRLKDVFKKTWFPFVEMNANEITWELPQYHYSYTGEYYFNIKGIPNQQIDTTAVLYRQPTYTDTWASYDTYGPVIVGNKVLNKQAKIGFRAMIRLRSKTKSRECVRLRALLMSFPRHAFGDNATTSVPQYFDIIAGADGYFTSEMDIELTIDQTSNWVNLGLQQLNVNQEGYSHLDFRDYWNIEVVYLKAVLRANKVQYGDRIPIVGNLPKMKVTAFIQSLMTMFGLFPYIDYRSEDNIVQFYSLDDIYTPTYLDSAVDWTHKLLSTDKQKVSFTLEDYANKNLLQYTSDQTTMDDKDLNAYLSVHGVLDAEKELAVLPFSPSDYVEGGCAYAQIKVLDAEDTYVVNSIKPRILYANPYALQGTKYQSLYFPQIFNFGGISGLLQTYYRKYQQTIAYPFVQTVYVYWDAITQLMFREINPIQIQGIYYVPMQVLLQGDVAEVKLVRLRI